MVQNLQLFSICYRYRVKNAGKLITVFSDMPIPWKRIIH